VVHDCPAGFDWMQTCLISLMLIAETCGVNIASPKRQKIRIAAMVILPFRIS
jgi:hypothetical protein